MIIDKLTEFAEEGDKSINGLSLITGFPRQQKPYRQWMNYIFNWLSTKTNEIVDEVNAINKRVEPLLQPIAVGEGFFTVNDYQSPSEVAEIRGYGTWQRFAEGRTLVGYSSKSIDMDQYRSMGNEFGENEHTITLAESAKHKHSTGLFNKFGSRASDTNTRTYTEGDNLLQEHEYGIGDIRDSQWLEATEKEAGENKPHNNIQPSIVVAYWLRVE